MSSPRERQLRSGDGAFSQYRMAEAEPLAGRPPASMSPTCRSLRPVPARCRQGGGNSACAASRPASASTRAAICSSVKVGGINSNTTGRYLILRPQSGDAGGEDAGDDRPAWAGREAKVQIRGTRAESRDYDGAEPAPTSVSAMNLLTLAHLTGETTYCGSRRRGDQVLRW